MNSNFDRTRQRYDEKNKPWIILTILWKFVKERIILPLHYIKYKLHYIKYKYFIKFGQVLPFFTKALYYIINDKPCIIITIWDFFELFPKILKKRKTYFIFLIWRSMRSEKIAQRAENEYIKHRKKYPEYELIYLCNSPKQYELLKKFSLPCIFCNHNALVDEDIYKIIPSGEKRYDAIYNARLLPCKRHFLASKIKNLALITSYALGSTQKQFNKIRKILPQATWFNKPIPGAGEVIPEREIYKYLNQARVGLCLSSAEGAMYASVEYLLCGLPVVSTRSEGGRDVFFDEEYVKIVDDTPDAIKEGVEEMIKRNIPPDYIRRKTLEKMKPHRERFIALIQNIYDRDGINKDFRKEWDEIFINKMIRWEKMKVIKQYINTK